MCPFFFEKGKKCAKNSVRFPEDIPRNLGPIYI